MPKLTRILVIEDNETNLELMVYLLQAFGYTTLAALDGETGLETVRRERPDLVICDVHLPKLNGYQIVAQLKRDSDLKTIPVLAVTALAMVGDREKILAGGFDGYISKPIAPETFVQQVETFLRPELRTQVLRPASAVVSRSDTEFQPLAGPGATILVVDDVPGNIDLARSTLEPSGYQVIVASNVPDALALAVEQSPDLVLCDLHMLPEDGRDLLVRAKAMDALMHIPVVIISSTSSRASERGECLERGAARFITRPIEPQTLLAEIAALLEKREETGK